MTSPESLDDIARDVQACTRCRLHQTRTRGVPGEGSGTAEVLFIGEGPGFNEDQQGRPFVGAAGQLLNQMLDRIGFRREDVFITNVVRSRPPGNRDPMTDELAACDVYTVRQLAVLKPKLIVTLGRFSMARFFGPTVRITQVHGQTTLWNGITCIAMFHPAAVLRSNSPAMRQSYEADFQRIPSLLEQLRTQPPAPKTERAVGPDQLDAARAEPGPKQPRLL
ncbi:MAG: uracil-DNA glycosylase [Chloroflexi bacterium]|nr:uracil-DNA glycosylase [Chloroflexota bacterium]